MSTTRSLITGRLPIGETVIRWPASTYFFHRKAHKIALEMSGLRNGMNVLEVATGSGEMFRRLVKHNPDGYTCGVDLSPNMAARTQAHARKQFPKSSLHCQAVDCRSLPYRDGSFDHIFCCYLYELLSTDDIYQRQGETIISWTEPANNCDVALSFADAAGCAELWEQILALQRAEAQAGAGGFGLADRDGVTGGGGSGGGHLGALISLGHDRGGALHGHLAWHAALAALERGDVAAATAIHDTHVRPAVSRGLPLNVLTDTVSLLWRMDAYGYPVPRTLWDEAAAYAAPLHPEAGFAFADVHMAMLHAATGEHAAVLRRADALAAMVEAGTLAAGAVVPAICRAALAFAAADYAGCARLLEPLASEVARIGGSGAQREIIEDTLLVALMRGGETGKARDMLDRRLIRRPSPRDAAWRDRFAR
jgi:hypothetical protein